MRRRDILRTGLGGVALTLLGGSCKTGSPPKPPPPVEPDESPPVYELTAGNSLYDDFDGHGNFQTFDGQELAEAGKLSSKLWAGTFGTEMLTYSVPSRPFTVVNEDGRRVEYGTPDPDAGALQDFLRKFPRPVTALEKYVLDKMLNDRGRAAAAGLEAASPDQQIKVLGYLLARKHDVLNETGCAWAGLLSDPTTAILSDERLAGLLKPSFGEAERTVLGELAGELRTFDRLRDSPLRTALSQGADLVRPGTASLAEYPDIEYVFDEEGRLLDAVPHASGRPYHASRRLLFKGAADALLETPSGPMLIEKGRLYGTAEPVPAKPGGTILKVTNALNSFIKIMSKNPDWLNFPEFKSCSADVMLSSASTGRNCAAGLDFHTTIPEQPPGKSWWAQIAIIHGATGETFLMGGYFNVNMGYEYRRKLGPAALDTWSNLRMDVVTRQDDARLGAEEIRLDFFVDGVYKDSLFPEDSPILLDRERIGLGPHRTLTVYSEGGFANAVGYFDNIRGVYKNRIR